MFRYFRMCTQFVWWRVRCNEFIGWIDRTTPNKLHFSNNFFPFETFRFFFLLKIKSKFLDSLLFCFLSCPGCWLLLFFFLLFVQLIRIVLLCCLLDFCFFFLLFYFDIRRTKQHKRSTQQNIKITILICTCTDTTLCHSIHSTHNCFGSFFAFKFLSV